MNIDIRTREGRESEVLEKIRTSKGFSIFWATENIHRAATIERLTIRGEIVSTGGEYPWCGFEVAK